MKDELGEANETNFNEAEGLKKKSEGEPEVNTDMAQRCKGSRFEQVCMNSRWEIKS